MEERLTWEEIVKRYPDQWLGLSKIEWEDTANIKSAVVTYVNCTEEELFMKSLTEDVECVYTTPDNVFQMVTLMME